MSDRIRHRVAGKVHSATLLTLLSPSVGGSECRVDCPLPFSSSTPCFLCFSPSLSPILLPVGVLQRVTERYRGLGPFKSSIARHSLHCHSLELCHCSIHTGSSAPPLSAQHVFVIFFGGRQTPVEKKTMFEGTA